MNTNHEEHFRTQISLVKNDYSIAQVVRHVALVVHNQKSEFPSIFEQMVQLVPNNDRKKHKQLTKIVNKIQKIYDQLGTTNILQDIKPLLINIIRFFNIAKLIEYDNTELDEMKTGFSLNQNSYDNETARLLIKIIIDECMKQCDVNDFTNTIVNASKGLFDTESTRPIIGLLSNYKDKKITIPFSIFEIEVYAMNIPSNSCCAFAALLLSSCYQNAEYQKELFRSMDEWLVDLQSIYHLHQKKIETIVNNVKDIKILIENMKTKMSHKLDVYLDLKTANWVRLEILTKSVISTIYLLENYKRNQGLGLDIIFQAHDININLPNSDMMKFVFDATTFRMVNVHFVFQDITKRIHTIKPNLDNTNEIVWMIYMYNVAEYHYHVFTCESKKELHEWK